MTTAKQAARPWAILATEHGSSRPYNVGRRKINPTAYEKYEYLKDKDGRNFATEQEATAAIAEATGS